MPCGRSQQACLDPQLATSKPTLSKPAPSNAAIDKLRSATKAAFQILQAPQQLTCSCKSIARLRSASPSTHEPRVLRIPNRSLEGCIGIACLVRGRSTQTAQFTAFREPKTSVKPKVDSGLTSCRAQDRLLQPTTSVAFAFRKCK